MPYKPKTKFEVKDTLPQDDPRKIIYGKEFGVEFDAISATFDEVQAGFDQVKDKLEAGGYSMEEAPAGGSQYGRQEINGTMTWTEIGSAGSVTWSEVSGKPSTYPPSAHNHDGQYLKTETDPVFTSSVAFGITQDDIDGWNAGGSGTGYDDTQIKADLATETQARIDGDAAIQAEVDDLENYDDTQIKADLATETQDRIDGDAALDLRIDAVEDSITDGGGFVDAPNDGKLYGRQSEGWSEVPDGGVSDWADIENKPTEFPPADHDQPWSSITDTPDDYPPSAHDHAWNDVTGKPTEFPPSAHVHTIANVTGLSDALDGKSDVGHKHVIADVTGLQDALNNASRPPVYVDEDAPENPAKGILWFDTNSGELNLFDGSGWVVIGSGGGDSKPEGYDDTKAIASGVMATGEMVVLNADGTVSVVKEVNEPQFIGQSESVGSLELPKLTYVSSTNEAVIYHEGGVRVVRVDGDAISLLGSTSSSASFMHQNMTYCAGPDRLVLVFRDLSNSKFGTAILGEIKSSVITFGTPIIFNSSDTYDPHVCYDPASDRIVIGYSDNGNSRAATAVVGEISSDKANIAFGTPKVVNPTYSGEIVCVFDPASGKVVLNYADNDSGYANTTNIGSVSNLDISFGPKVTMNDSTSHKFMTITPAPDEGKVVFIYKETVASSNSGSSVVGTIDDNTILFGERVDFDNDNSNISAVSYDPFRKMFTVAYRNVTADHAGRMVTGKLSGDALVFAEPVPFKGKSYNQGIVYDPDSKRNVVFYDDPNDGGAGYVIAYSAEGITANLTDSNYIGVSTGNYADGSEATVQIAGINADQQGMTVGKQYILPDGSLDTTEGTPSVLAGTAISSTELNIKDTV